MTRRSEADGPTWYKDAVIYELRTRSFFDSNDDGIGDFRGLTARLDYLQDLGVTAVWLLPFYPSPGRDDGYDISDYTGVHPDVGTLADFEALLKEAHARGLRVITELVLNHTSDQHPWFQRARRAPAGSPDRDFYVWTESPDRYRDARIIFKDFEPSNWTWDREASAYYWHRFYAHQPDLNFENPAVHEALLEVVDFWLGLGVDGLRLDAVPYLYEQEATSCENLPATHAFLKKLRAHIDAKFPGRMLLAEANQWPEDAAAYFGDGDECHMNFHFPLMPRMFMAIHMEDRLPIVDIFAQTPEVHPSCQWALFLRNHDELTLEMVTDEERDYMVRAYADQAAMRINLGIRRRLAPLVGNNRLRMELLNGLLFSLPGTPVLYYGDEIGMGDNVYLGDRNGVRTPMQWSMDRNAGFSRANPQKLVLPVVIDPQYHYESLNVENQQQNPTSLLWWTKRLIAMRKRFSAFGRGSIEFLSPSNSRVLVFVRRHEDETILVVANLSRFAQYAELDLSSYRGATPVELFGRNRFPVIGDAPYMLSLGPHGFFWFSLERPAGPDERFSVPPPEVPIECASVDELMTGRTLPALDDALVTYVQGRSWFAGRGRVVRAAHVEEIVALAQEPRRTWLTLVRLEYPDSPPELYAVPVCWWPGERPQGSAPPVALVRVTGDPAAPAQGALVDAFEDPLGARALLETILRPGAAPSSWPLAVERVDDVAMPEPTAEPRRLGVERDHSTAVFGERLVLKLYRRVDEGPCPELEMERLLDGEGSGLAPRLCGVLERKPRSATAAGVLALVQAFVPNGGTAWQAVLHELGRFYERVLARSPDGALTPPPRGSPMLLAGVAPPPEVAEMIGNFRDTAALLGARVAALHLVLGRPTADAAFAPEPYTALDRRAKYQTLRTLSGKVLAMLRGRLPLLPARERQEAMLVLSREREILKRFEALLKVDTGALRIRVHGSLHLGHVLVSGKDFVITSFNGYPPLTLAERRRKRSPLRDLAWAVRSFELAASKLLLDPGRVREGDFDAARPWALHWSSWTSAAFLDAYLAATRGAAFVPESREVAASLFDAFVVERALYQLKAALDDSSAALMVPLLGMVNVLG